MQLEPCGWHERVELGTGWMGVMHELGEEPLEVAERIGALGADLLDEGVDDRTAPACVCFV